MHLGNVDAPAMIEGGDKTDEDSAELHGRYQYGTYAVTGKVHG